MDDTEKKAVNYTVNSEDGKELFDECDKLTTDEEVVNRLRQYIQKFYEIQQEKNNEDDKNGEV